MSPVRVYGLVEQALGEHDEGVVGLLGDVEDVLQDARDDLEVDGVAELAAGEPLGDVDVAGDGAGAVEDEDLAVGGVGMASADVGQEQACC
jgi:hypothetical protein